MNINVFVDINDNYETFPGVEDLYDLDLSSLEKLQTNIQNNNIKPYLDEDGEEIMSKEDMLGFVNAEIKERNQMKDILNFFLVDTQPNEASETTNYNNIDISFDKAKPLNNNDVQPNRNDIINNQLPQKQTAPIQYTTITTNNNNVITNTQNVTKCTTGIKALLNKTKIDASNFQYVVGNSIVQKYAWAPDPARLKRKTISPIKNNNVHVNNNNNSGVNSSISRSGKERNKRCIISSSSNNNNNNHSVIAASKKNEENKIVIAVPEMVQNKQKPRTLSKRYKKKKKESEMYNSHKHKEEKTQLEIRQQYVVPVPTKKRATSVVVVKQEQEKDKQQRVNKEKEDKKEINVINTNNIKIKDKDKTINIKSNEEEKKKEDIVQANTDTIQAKTFNQVELCSHQADVCYKNENENVNNDTKHVDVDNNTVITNKHYTENISDLNNNMIESESTLTHLKNGININDNCTSNHISFLSSNHQLSINESKDTNTNKNNTNILQQSKEENEEDEVEHDNNNNNDEEEEAEEETEKEQATETVNQVSVSKSHDSVQYEILKHEAKGQLDYILNFNPPQPKPQNRMIYQQDEPDLISEENEDLFTTEGNNETTTNNTNSILSNLKLPLNNIQSQHKEQNTKPQTSNNPKNNKLISPRSMFSPHTRKFISNNKLSNQQQSTDSQSMRSYRLSATSHSNFITNDKPQTALHRIKGTPHPNHTFYKESSQQISTKSRAHSSKPTSFPFSSLSSRLTSSPGFEIKDYSHLYKSFNELFNGHFLSSTYSQAKNYNYASTISSLYESFKHLHTYELNPTFIEQKDALYANIVKAEAGVIQNRLRKVSEKLLNESDCATSPEKHFLLSKVLELEKKNYSIRQKDDDSQTKLFFRVVLSRPEIYDIVCYILGVKEQWSELPHGLSLGYCWNLLWTYAAPNIDFTKIFSFQKVNHLINNRTIHRKDMLKKHIMRIRNMNKRLYNLFDIMPQTFLLSKEYMDFIEEYHKIGKDNPLNLWIVKPISKSRGKGIFLVDDISDVPLSDTYLAQKYLTNPLLLEGYKFDMRIYVLVTSVNPLEVFLYKDGFARVSNEKFDLFTKNNKIHLTNAAIQNFSAKKSGNFEKVYGGSKISLDILKYKLNKYNGINFSKQIWPQVKSIILKALVACQNDIPYAPSCFELFGFDIIIDEDLKCWLLEINSSPSLERSNVLDDQIKLPLVDDILNIVDPVNIDRAALLKVLERVLGVSKKTGTGEGVYLYSPAVQLNIDLTQIFQGKVPRAYGEMPEKMGRFERIAPTKESDKLIKMTGGQKMFGVKQDNNNNTSNNNYNVRSASNRIHYKM